MIGNKKVGDKRGRTLFVTDSLTNSQHYIETEKAIVLPGIVQPYGSGYWYNTFSTRPRVN